MKKNETVIWAITAVLTSILSFQWAWAQENKPEQMEIETLTVTARKQKENVQEVPASITVFNNQSIEDKQIQAVEDLGDIVPNLVFVSEGQNGRKTPSMRGLNATSFNFTSTTGLYVDGVPLLNGAGYESEILDIERIEVLRGPQGTLYGKNTETGVINIITRQPGNTFSAKITAKGGALLSTETSDRMAGSLSASLSGPIVNEKLYIGVAGRYYSKDGFVKNTVTGDTMDDRKHWFGRGHLRWTPTEKLDISFIATGTEFDDDAPSVNNTDTTAAGMGVAAPEYRKIPCNKDGYNQSVADSQALKAIYDINDALTLTSVSTRRVYHEDTDGDWDFSTATISHLKIDRSYKKISQELRMDYAKDRLKWLVGAYYDRDDKGVGYDSVSDYSSFNETTARDYEENAHAIFANLVYPVTQRLGVVAGLRWECQESEFTDHLDGRNYEDDWETLSPKAGLEYRISPDIMTYATVSKGHRSGGFNSNLAIDAPSQYQRYDTEELWSYEAGIKSAFFNKRLILNAAAYYMDINDMQVTEAISILQTYRTNAAKGKGKGIELEIMGRVTNGLTLSAGFGYSNVEFDEFSDIWGDYAGNKNPLAPEYTFNLGAHYRHPTGFTARVDLTGCGKMYFDKANEYSRDAYEIVNMKVGYETEHFDIYLYGKNIFDKDYTSYGYYDGYYTVYSEPGEVGLEVAYRF